MTRHQDSIVEQFTRQAAHFAEMPGHNDEESLQLLESFLWPRIAKRVIAEYERLLQERKTR